jgi:hypothetical protein
LGIPYRAASTTSNASKATIIRYPSSFLEFLPLPHLPSSHPLAAHITQIQQQTTCEITLSREEYHHQCFCACTVFFHLSTVLAERSLEPALPLLGLCWTSIVLRTITITIYIPIAIAIAIALRLVQANRNPLWRAQVLHSTWRSNAAPLIRWAPITISLVAATIAWLTIRRTLMIVLQDWSLERRCSTEAAEAVLITKICLRLLRLRRLGVVILAVDGAVLTARIGRVVLVVAAS